MTTATKPRVFVATTMPGYDDACALDQASTSALCEHADCIIICHSKAGIEMAALSVPVARGREQLTPLGHPLRRLVEHVTEEDATAALDISRAATSGPYNWASRVAGLFQQLTGTTGLEILSVRVSSSAYSSRAVSARSTTGIDTPGGKGARRVDVLWLRGTRRP